MKTATAYDKEKQYQNGDSFVCSEGIVEVIDDSHKNKDCGWCRNYDINPCFRYDGYCVKLISKRLIEKPESQIKVYISIPIDGKDYETQYNHAEMIESQLKKQGYQVKNPFKNGLPRDADRRDHMRRDIAMLMECDIIWLCPGWAHSKGCRLELDNAAECGIEMYTEDDNETEKIQL